ncbi:Group 1 truncated hemoglobin GlbN [Pseudovibrio axinellae]|uniref:Group 1 truncated hemoglobin GlbN n=1 Tax=Pseudovibrio axinellae TaxID=989403 RepID=A0A165WYN4_9HYPH|nr:group 1 truncated hemoglobin [Pseudovibrio axinellae]KZL17043.1 Group 1 truncated hemoglobin GlbN [Pseudovibrio axinellae]SEQ17382.1 hemoglobin [Pseudovibrio axinellae]
MSNKTLYERLGGYDAISAVVNNLLPRLQSDELLGRFWQNRGEDGIAREKQLLIDYLAYSAGGPLYYTGRDMVITHTGMGVTEADWDVFLAHLKATLESFNLPEAEFNDTVGFVSSLKAEILV